VAVGKLARNAVVPDVVGDVGEIERIVMMMKVDSC